MLYALIRDAPPVMRCFPPLFSRTAGLGLAYLAGPKYEVSGGRATASTGREGWKEEGGTKEGGERVLQAVWRPALTAPPTHIPGATCSVGVSHDVPGKWRFQNPSGIMRWCWPV